MFVLTESVEGETASRQSQLPTFSHIFRVKHYLQYLKTVVPKVGGVELLPANRFFFLCSIRLCFCFTGLLT